MDEFTPQYRANRLAPVMFCLSALFVVLVATLIVLWADIPRVAELSVLTELETNAERLSQLESDPQALTQLVNEKALVKLTDPFGKMVQLALFVLWPLFWLEFLVGRLRRVSTSAFTKGEFIRLLACAVPPLRLAAPSAEYSGQIWLPRLQWQTPGKELSRLLERIFSKPMLVIALLILPILLIQYGLHDLVESQAWLRLLLHATTGFIWCAFTIEFLIMVSATDKRLAYVQKHWIDLAIILLPLVSFLRSIRVLRLAKLAKVQKLARMGRVFRMRGLLMKTIRALMLIGFVNRLLRITPEKQLLRLKAKYQEQLEDLRETELQIQELEISLSDDNSQARKVG